MKIDIQHKHASHVIIIGGKAFKANDSGMWDLTDIWQTLKLPKGKAPAQWRTKQAQRLIDMQNLQVIQGRAAQTLATKRATIEFAGWVSEEFKDMVYDAFEAILEMPEVALLVADKMRSMGNAHSADILERHVFNDKCDWNALKGFKKARSQRPLSPAEKERQKWLRQAKAHESANPMR